MRLSWKRKGRAESRRGPGAVQLGTLRRLEPVSRAFGFDRGLPLDRYYIEDFLARHAGDIRGRVMEFGDDGYTRRFGAGRVVASDIFDVSQSNPHATIVGDLAHAGQIPSERFDCIIFTQTMQLIYEVRLALRTLRRILKPGGVLLATFPGISKLHADWGYTWHWAFTAQAARRLFTETFPDDEVAVHSYGNVLAAISFLHGIATGELRRAELDYADPRFEVSIAVRARKLCGCQ